VTVTVLDRPSDRARGGHDLLICRYLSDVQRRPDRSASWHDHNLPICTRAPSAGSRSRRWLPTWLPVPHSCLIVSVAGVTCFTAGLMLGCPLPDRSVTPEV
jgi:hypothetical protein